MLSRFISRLSQTILNLEKTLSFTLKGEYSRVPIQAEVLDTLGGTCIITHPSLQHDSVLWAAPKKRRTVEKRLSRKFGWPYHVWKPLVPKKNLITCKSCGGHYEAGFLCPNCYLRVKTETEETQRAIEKEMGLKPVDKEVVVLYKEENEGYTNNFFKGKQLVEIDKKRPQWFSKNLLEKSSKGLVSTLIVKPSDLA